MTIKQVDIELNYRLNVEDAIKVLPLLLDGQVLEKIQSFQAVAILNEAGIPQLGDPFHRARRLQLTTRDLSEEDVDETVTKILAATAKFALGETTVVQLFPLKS